MLFRRIAVRNFRKLASPAVVDGLGHGVTIIAGDNEEGKSTLLLAVRTGLFERHNLGGKAVETMQPFGSSVRPEIRLDFEIDGQSYSITKTFAHKSSAILTTSGGTFEGPAAEERLAQLLTFRVPQRGESKPDDRGILGLFWLEQGRVIEGLGFGEMGRSTLRTSLEQEVGDVLGGARGCRLLAAATAKRDALLTATGRPRGELATAIEEAETAQQRVIELEAERQAYDQEIEELARLRRELARIDSDSVLDKARENLTAAEEQERAIGRLRQQEDAAEQAVALAEAQVGNARDRWTQRSTLIQTSEDRGKGLTNAHAVLVELQEETQRLVSQLDAAGTTLASAIEARTAAEGRVILSQARARAKTLEEEIAELNRRITEVDRFLAERTAALDRLTKIKIDKRAFEELQRLEGQMREAQAALGAIATRVRFSPTGAQEVLTTDEKVIIGASIEVTEATRFVLEGFGNVDIHPGASELSSRRARFADAKDALRKALVASGITSLGQAKSQFEERTKAENAKKETDRLITAYAPEGVGALREAQQEKLAERVRLNEEHDLSLGVAVGDPEIETRSLASSRAAEESARLANSQAEQGHQQHAIQIATARLALETADEALATATRDLNTARAEICDTDLAAVLDACQKSLDQKKINKEAAKSQLIAANPEEIELRRSRARATLDTVETEQRQLREQIIALESRLAALGEDGLGELLEDARGRAVQNTAKRDRLQIDARAFELLVETLSSAEREAKEEFLEPILKTVRPFLRLLFPGAGLAFDEETLEITEVTREGREEPYEALSIGTREQLCILVRLAFAVYLRQKGYPAAVILDDALVYADDERFERMQLALRKAAESVQILILTCRPRDWREFGAPIRRLADAATRSF